MRHLRRSAATALLVASLACVQTGTGTPERVEVSSQGGAEGAGVAFELAGPGEAAVLVPVHVDGEGPFQLVVDTGATLTCLDRELVERLDLPDARGQRGVGFGIGGDGGGRMRLVEVESLRVGDATAEGLTACTVDLSAIRGAGIPAEGLLGLDFLRSFRVTFDFEARRLLLEPP